MKIAIYVRVSTSDQSTEMQLRDLNEFIKNRGWEIHQVYEDIGISGTKASRPALNRLMNDARSRKFKAVVVWKFDRFARSLKHLITALEEFSELGVDFVSYKENLDTTTSMGKAMFGMIGVMAQLERDIIRDRVIAGLKNAKAKGKRLGPKIKVNGPKVLALRAKGLSMAKIAREMDISVGSVHLALNPDLEKA